MMRSLFFSFIFFLFYSVVHAQEDTRNILFIGNSITYFNEMPQTVKNIANDKGHPTQVTMHAPGGTGFVHHVESDHVYNLFRQGNWDYVVLQPGSGESGGVSQTKEQTLLRAKKLNDSIRKYNPCAEVLYYQISNGVWGSTPENLETYNASMQTIKSNFDYWADHTPTYYAPAGEAMRTAWNNDTNTLLWGNTGDIHPNAKGSYLIACTIYATIFQEPSSGSDHSVNGLSAEEMSYYQNIADSTVFNHLPSWNIEMYNQHAQFSYIINGNQIQFNNESSNATSYHWDFGDGTSSVDENPLHQYNQDGIYQVRLTTINGDCQRQISKQIDFHLSVEEVENSKIKIYPNPFQDKIVVEANGLLDSDFRVYNVLGQVVSFDLLKISHHHFELILNSLEKGVYFVEVKGVQYKMIKN